MLVNSKMNPGTTKFWIATNLTTLSSVYTAVSRKVALQTGKSLRHNVKSYYGLWWFLHLLEWASRCFSVVNGNSTNTCISSFSFFVAESPWTSIKQSQTLDSHNANRHCGIRFYTFAGQPYGNSCMSWFNLPIGTILYFPFSCYIIRYMKHKKIPNCAKGNIEPQYMNSSFTTMCLWTRCSTLKENKFWNSSNKLHKPSFLLHQL